MKTKYDTCLSTNNEYCILILSLCIVFGCFCSFMSTKTALEFWIVFLVGYTILAFMLLATLGSRLWIYKNANQLSEIVVKWKALKVRKDRLKPNCDNEIQVVIKDIKKPGYIINIQKNEKERSLDYIIGTRIGNIKVLKCKDFDVVKVLKR